MQTLLAIAALLTPEAPLLPADLGGIAGSTERHDACVVAIAANVEEGRRAAERWVADGGGAPALHCLAIADLSAGFPRLAAVRLTEIAERADAGDERTRARLLAEAALAWLDADDPQQAEEAVAKAKKIAPALPELDFVAAKAFASAEKWQSAADAVTAAEKAGARSAEAYAIRARAHRALGRDLDAADDVVAALTLDPFYIDALTLRGELIQAGVEIEAYYGDEAGADN